MIYNGMYIYIYIQFRIVIVASTKKQNLWVARSYPYPGTLQRIPPPQTTHQPQSTPQSPQPACQHLNLVSANTGERSKMSCRPSKTASVTYPRCSMLCSSSCVHSIYVFLLYHYIYTTHEIHTMTEYVWQQTRFSLSSPRTIKPRVPSPSIASPPGIP